MQTATEAGEERILARLAVIESKIDTLVGEIVAIRKYVPAGVVEHSERISVLERNMRTFQWIAGVFASTLIGAFLAHVLGK